VFYGDDNAVTTKKSELGDYREIKLAGISAFTRLLARWYEFVSTETLAMCVLLAVTSYCGFLAHAAVLRFWEPRLRPLGPLR